MKIMLFFLALGQFSYSQIRSEVFLYQELDSTGYNNSLFLQSELSLNSNGLNNLFIHKIYGGEYINTEDKSKILDNIDELTRFGGDLTGALTYVHKVDSNNFLNAFQLSFGHYAHIDGITNDQMLGLFLNGNKSYIGETITGSHSNFSLINYQKFTFSMVKNMKRTSKFGVGISFLNGQNFQSLDLNDFSLNTYEEGRSVDLSVGLESSRSDTSIGNIGTSSGLGASLDFFVAEEMNLFKSGSKGYFIAELRDLGYILWNNETLIENIDTSLLGYEGFEIQNIFDLNDSTNTFSVDSLFQKRSVKEKGVKSVLPGALTIRVAQNFGNHQFELRLNQRTVSNALVHVGFRYGYLIKNTFKPSVNIGYGGFGKFNFGIGLELDLGPFAIYASSSNIEGFILKSYSGGTSGYMGLKARF